MGYNFTQNGYFYYELHWADTAVDFGETPSKSIRFHCLLACLQLIRNCGIYTVMILYLTLMVFPNVILLSMLTSSNGNIFRVTVPLCGNPPITGEFNLTKGQQRGPLMFFWCQFKQIVEQKLNWPVIRDAMTVIWRSPNVHRTFG